MGGVPGVPWGLDRRVGLCTTIGRTGRVVNGAARPPERERGAAPRKGELRRVVEAQGVVSPGAGARRREEESWGGWQSSPSVATPCSNLKACGRSPLGGGSGR